MFKMAIMIFAKRDIPFAELTLTEVTLPGSINILSTYNNNSTLDHPHKL
jgi:hypothetical protein